LSHPAPRPSQPAVSPFHLRAPSGLQLTKFHLLNQCVECREHMAAMWSSDHSTIYRSLHLCLAIANDLSSSNKGHKDRSEVTVMHLGYQINSYNLMHIQESQLRYNNNKNSRMVVRCTGTCLVLLVVTALDWCWLRRLLVSWLRVAYRNYASMRHQHNCNARGTKSGKMHNHGQPIHVNPYKLITNSPLVFLVLKQFNYDLEI
jgi:hypothetical protein